MSIPEELLENIQQDVRLYENHLKQIAEAILNQNISQYPIFVAHREQQITLGRPVVTSEKMNSDWSINVSLLEEFVRKNLIEQNKVLGFQQIFKDPKEYMCLFVVSGTSDAGFVFCPYRG